MRACRNIFTNAVIDVVLNEESDPPIAEPVTPAEAKAWLKMEGTFDADSQIITNLITEGRRWVENRCGISVVQKGVQAIVEVMNYQELPYGPVADLSSISVLNDEGETVVGPRIVGLDGGYPSIEGFGRFTVSYDAGMTAVPQDIKGAILSYVAFAYENRGDEIDESDEPFAKLARKKSNPYRRTTGF